LTGSPTSSCQPDGQWSNIAGDACGELITGRWCWSRSTFQLVFRHSSRWLRSECIIVIIWMEHI
jgi:hypothetical protein